MKTSKQPTGDRRKFLLGATLGSAGAVAAVVSGSNLKAVLETARAGANCQARSTAAF